MRLDLVVDAKAVVGEVKALAGFMPQVQAVAMNRTAEWGTKIGRDRAPDYFHVRVLQALRYAFPVVIPSKERATPSKLAVTIEPARSGAIYGPFEEGIPHTIDRLGRAVAVPTAWLRPSESDVIPRAWYPVSLGLQPKRDPKGRVVFNLGRGSIKKGLTPYRRSYLGKVQIQGKRGTFVLDPKYHDVSEKAWGVYKRVGPGKRDVQRLWYYTSRVPRPRVLGYFQSIQRGVDEHWSPEVAAAFAFYARLAAQRSARYASG